MSGCLLEKVIQYKSREGLVVVRATAKGACQSLGCHCIRLTEGQHTLRGEGRSGRGRGREGVGGEHKECGGGEGGGGEEERVRADLLNELPGVFLSREPFLELQGGRKKRRLERVGVGRGIWHWRWGEGH